MLEDYPDPPSNETKPDDHVIDQSQPPSSEHAPPPELVKVRRSDGTIDDGWQVVSHIPARDDGPARILVSKSENGELLTKNILPEHLLEANRPADQREEFHPYAHLFNDELPIPDEVQVRNYFLEQRFMNDRDKPLPQVRLHQEQPERLRLDFPDARIIAPSERQGNTLTYEIQAEDGRRLGFAVLKEPYQAAVDEGQKYRYIGDIMIEQADRGKGYGSAAYLEILKSLPIHYRLRTEGVLSSDALKVWQDLARRGLAEDSAKGGSFTGFETTF